jgi:hypothetical protein
MAAIDPLTAGAVFLATAGTDAVYVMFTSAVVHRKRVPAATWSSVWYVLSSYAVISYTDNWVYVRVCRYRLMGRRLLDDHVLAPPARRPAGWRGAGVVGILARISMSAGPSASLKNAALAIVILRAGGGSSTPRLLDSIIGVSGILDHPHARRMRG